MNNDRRCVVSLSFHYPRSLGSQKIAQHQKPLIKTTTSWCIRKTLFQMDNTLKLSRWVLIVVSMSSLSIVCAITAYRIFQYVPTNVNKSTFVTLVLFIIGYAMIVYELHWYHKFRYRTSHLLILSLSVSSTPLGPNEQRSLKGGMKRRKECKSNVNEGSNK